MERIHLNFGLEWYEAYKSDLRLATNKGTYLSKTKSDEAPKIVNSDHKHFTATRYVLIKEVWLETNTSQELFKETCGWIW